MVSAPDCGSGGPGFESLYPPDRVHCENDVLFCVQSVGVRYIFKRERTALNTAGQQTRSGVIRPGLLPCLSSVLNPYILFVTFCGLDLKKIRKIRKGFKPVTEIMPFFKFVIFSGIVKCNAVFIIKGACTHLIIGRRK